MPCKLSPYKTICMECQSLLSGKNKKKDIVNLLSAEIATNGKGKMLETKLTDIKMSKYTLWQV